MPAATELTWWQVRVAFGVIRWALRILSVAPAVVLAFLVGRAWRKG